MNLIDRELDGLSPQLSERLRRLQATEAISAAVIASSLDCIVVADEAGLVVDFNPAAEATFGYGRDEAIGRPLAELIVPPHMRALHVAGMARYMASGEARVLGRRVELEAMRSDGSLIPVELAITEVRLPERRLFTAHLRDLTEARAARAEIERQREALFQSEKMAALGSLLAGIAHELNNPLSVVLGQAMMMRESLDEMDRATVSQLTERSRSIEQAAERCARIVRSFLAIARQRKAEKKQVPVHTVIDQVIELLGYGLRTAGIEVVRRVGTGLPDVWADPDQVHQVIMNLVVNARQALEAQDGARRIEIDARFDQAAGEVVVRIADTGNGIPEAIRSRIFDPFFTTKPQGEGTGIGLAVSRGLIEANDGSLRLVDSPAGTGAAFELRLPTGRRTAPEPQPEPEATPHRERVCRALVIDDEAEIAALLCEILGKRGVAADRAASGREACALIAGGDGGYDVVLCDIRMPDMDGPSFHAWLTRHQSRLTDRIVFVTGDVLGPAAGKFLASCGAPVVEKPFVPGEIWSVVAPILEQADAAR